MTRTEQLVIGDMQESMKQAADAFDVIEAGFTFLADNRLETTSELLQQYKTLDEKLGLQRSAIARQLYGEPKSVAEAALASDLFEMLGK